MDTYFRNTQGRLDRLETVAPTRSESAYVRATNFFGTERVAAATRSPSAVPESPQRLATEQRYPTLSTQERTPLTPEQKMARLREVLTEERAKEQSKVSDTK